MTSTWFSLFLVLLIQSKCVFGTSADIEKLVNDPRHLQRFGFDVEPLQKVDTVEGFPFTKDFFRDYVVPSKPVLMKNAAKMSKAFERWSDEYFLASHEPADSEVLVESRKKEDRGAPAVHMSFKDFVRVYNTTDQYMVNTVPQFIASDVVLPTPLQCQVLADDTLADAVMWFSSGGTKSVVHTDSVDNINCLFRGEKELYFVDPMKYGNDVDIDRPDGAFSMMDVDKVDLTKYPGIANIQYISANMSAGDCLFIPYKWIHQVRSYGSNLAVNVWWDYHVAIELDLNHCEDKFDPEFTLDKVKLQGMGYNNQNINLLIDHFKDFTRKGGVDFMGMLKMIVQDHEELNKMDAGKGYQAPILQVFSILDKNKNQIISRQEVDEASDDDWDEVQDLMNDFDDIVADVEEQWYEYNGGEGRGDEDDEEEEPKRDEL